MDEDLRGILILRIGSPGRFIHIRALVSADSERYQDKKIPADNTYVKQVHNPEAFWDSQREE